MTTQDREHMARRSLHIPASSRLGRGAEAVPRAASASDDGRQVQAIVNGVTDALMQFGIGVSAFGVTRALACHETTKELTLVVQASGAQCCCLAMGFERAVAARVAARVSATLTGEGGDPNAPGMVRDALAEFGNIVLNSLLHGLGLQGTVAPPWFIEGRASPLPLENPDVSFCGIEVQTACGSFDLWLAPGGTIIRDGPAVGEAKTRAYSAVVADDSSLMRKALRRGLEAAGITVVAEAADGSDAVELFRRHHPDLVTLDLTMPKVDGLTALRIIRADDPAARILVCSATREHAVRAFRGGNTAYVCKPFTPEGLAGAALRLLATRGPVRTPTAEEGWLGLVGSKLGHFEIRGFLSQGGMGAVYRGVDLNLRREVALKVLGEEFAGTPERVVQFLAEARSLARVRHRNVVEVYFAGTEGGKHFFAMELLPGPDLEMLVRRQGPLSFDVALNYLHQAAEGLRAASKAGLTHCDVKPSNLILGVDGWLRVTDFGLARAIGAGPDDEDTVVGSPPYMAPEQFCGQPVDRRTDIYSLGCTWYHLLAGREPFEASDGVEYALRHIHDPVPEVPGAPVVTEILCRMMAKAPADRYPDYGELLGDLAKLV